MICCSKCGAKAKPRCNCGVAYVPAHVFAANAVKANPEKSDRAIANQIGVSDKTVAKARKATAEKSAVEKRTGKDGKARKLPTNHRTMTNAVADAMKARAEAVARLFPPPVKTIPKAARAELIAALRMLAKSRDTAATLVERQRVRLNLSWEDLIVPDESTMAVAPAKRTLRLAPAA
jgi:hypothetical protein